MSFTLETLYDTEKKILTCIDSVVATAKCKKLEELAEATLITPQIKKHHLASLILNLVETVRSTQCVLKRASVKMEKLQSDCITSQKSVINLQEQLIQCKDEEVVAVQSTVKSEIKSWADVVSKSESRKQLTTQSIQNAVKSAMGEDQRCKNVLIFGLQEAGNDDELRVSVEEIMDHCSGGSTSIVKDFVRIGAMKSDMFRPVKVSLKTREAAVRVLSGAKKWKFETETAVSNCLHQSG